LTLRVWEHAHHDNGGAARDERALLIRPPLGGATAFRDVTQSANDNRQSKIIVIHLAARVGGIGANREHPTEFFYDNLMTPAPTAGAV